MGSSVQVGMLWPRRSQLLSLPPAAPPLPLLLTAHLQQDGNTSPSYCHCSTLLAVRLPAAAPPAPGWLHQLQSLP